MLDEHNVVDDRLEVLLYDRSCSTRLCIYLFLQVSNDLLGSFSFVCLISTQLIHFLKQRVYFLIALDSYILHLFSELVLLVPKVIQKLVQLNSYLLQVSI